MYLYIYILFYYTIATDGNPVTSRVSFYRTYIPYLPFRLSSGTRLTERGILSRRDSTIDELGGRECATCTGNRKFLVGAAPTTLPGLSAL